MLSIVKLGRGEGGSIGYTRKKHSILKPGFYSLFCNQLPFSFFKKVFFSLSQNNNFSDKKINFNEGPPPHFKKYRLSESTSIAKCILKEHVWPIPV